MKILKTGHVCPKFRNDKTNVKNKKMDTEGKKPKQIGKKILYALAGLSAIGMAAVQIGRLKEQEEVKGKPNAGITPEPPSNDIKSGSDINIVREQPSFVSSDISENTVSSAVGTKDISQVSESQRSPERKELEDIIRTLNSFQRNMINEQASDDENTNSSINEELADLMFDYDKMEAYEDGTKVTKDNKTYIFSHDGVFQEKITATANSEIIETFDENTEKLKTRTVKQFYPNDFGVKNQVVIYYDGNNKYSQYTDDFHKVSKHYVKNGEGGYSEVYRHSTSGNVETYVSKFGNWSFKNVDDYTERSTEITVRNKKGGIEFHEKYFWDKNVKEAEEKQYEKWYLEYLKLCEKYHVTPRPCGVEGGAWSHYYELCLREYNPEEYEKYLRLEEYRAQYDEKAALMLDLRNGNAVMDEQGKVEVLLHSDSSIERLQNKNNYLYEQPSQPVRAKARSSYVEPVLIDEEPVWTSQYNKPREVQHVYA